MLPLSAFLTHFLPLSLSISVFFSSFHPLLVSFSLRFVLCPSNPSSFLFALFDPLRPPSPNRPAQMRAAFSLYLYPRIKAYSLLQKFGFEFNKTPIGPLQYACPMRRLHTLNERMYRSRRSGSFASSTCAVVKRMS